jgi:cytoskeletal protein CcmA (bactofilin family)
VSVSSGHAVIQKGDSLTGQIRNGRRVEVYGDVEGTIETEALVIHEGGQVIGTVRAQTVEVRGLLEGEGVIKNLIDIGATGSVVGNIRYGRIAMAPGGNLSADLRNIPPELTGDFQMTVAKGRAARVTTADITAFDPDDTAATLIFQVTRCLNGRVAFADAPGRVLTQFSQVDLNDGRVFFEHDGSDSISAGFDIIVTDHAGATSGSARTVNVSVRQAFAA